MAEKGLSLQVLTVVSQAAGLWEGFCLGTGCEGKHPYQWTDMGLNSMKEKTPGLGQGMRFRICPEG